MPIRDAVIVATARTGMAKSFRGSFNLTRPDDMAAHCVREAMKRATDAGFTTARWTLPGHTAQSEARPVTD